MLLPLILAATASAAHAAASPPFTLVRAFPTLPLEAPVYMEPSGDGSGRLFVGEKSGLVRVFHPARPDTGRIFLDLRPQARDFRPETGLLGIAFHPGFAANGRFFVHYSGRNFRTVLSEFRVSADDPDRAGPRERILLVVPQPTDSHNGGHIEFGPDGFLYVGLGDGGGVEGEPRRDHGQDLTTLLGAILRIDVDAAGDDYAIPADNPFAGNDRGWREEI
ncbi:MAG: PQQ-dependent sugar dehydrogenase, partial [Gemmatimonadaceae bacterium]|nr:PQQ-dependent sugar dehydrogenase [Gemmatimonadaceae bacterium]